MRLFIAVNFKSQIEKFASLRDVLKKSALKGRFSENENLHLTLVFLGECDIKQAETVKVVLNGIQFSPFLIKADKIDFFKRDGGDIYSVRLKENEQLFKLQADLSNCLLKAGFVLENRKYTPHITLGREIRMPLNFILPKFEPIEFSVSSIELLKSEYKNGKLTYIFVYSKSSS